MANNNVVIDTTIKRHNMKYSVMAFDNIIRSSVITGDSEDYEYPIINAFDDVDHTKYSPLSNSGTVTITFKQDVAKHIDYFGMAIHNCSSAGLTGKVEFKDLQGVWHTAAEFMAITDSKPFLSHFEGVTSKEQRIVLTHTNKLYIGSLAIGKAIVFESMPSMGFKDGRYNQKAKLYSLSTQGNSFIMGRYEDLGANTSGVFKFVQFSMVNAFWDEYYQHVIKSRAIYFKANQLVSTVMYGRQDIKKMPTPAYSTVSHTDFNFNINGYV